MNGHIQKRGKNSWRIIVEVGRDADDRRIRKSITVRGKKAHAEAELRRFLHEADKGVFVEPSRMTVADYLEQWLRDYAAGAVSGKTYQGYEQIVRTKLIPSIGQHPLSKLTPMHIQNYYTSALAHGRSRGEGGLSARTVLSHHRVLHRALKQAVRWRILAANPADAVDPPRARPVEMKVLGSAETARLLNELRGSRYHMPALIAAGTGMRRGEVLALRWSEVDLDNRCLYVTRSLEQTKAGLKVKSPKTGKGRRIDLPEILVVQLRRHKAEQARDRLALGAAYADEDLIVCREDGTAVKPDSFTTAFRSRVRQLGFEISFHSLRHGHATQLLEHGTPVKVVSERLGHATTSITLDVYGHVMPGMQAEAASTMNDLLSQTTERQASGS